MLTRSSVTSVGKDAFHDCDELNYVKFMGNSDPSHDGNPFEGCEKLTVIHVPSRYEQGTFCEVTVDKMSTHKFTVPLNYRNPARRLKKLFHKMHR